MFKLSQLGIPSVLSQSVSNYLKVSRNNLQTPLLRKLLQNDNVGMCCFHRSCENDMETLLGHIKKVTMGKLSSHIEEVKKTLNIEKNTPIETTFTSIRKVGGVRRKSTAFECSLCVRISSLLSFRSLGKGLTPGMAKKSAIDIFIRTTKCYVSKLSNEQGLLKYADRKKSCATHSYSSIGVNVLRDLRRSQKFIENKENQDRNVPKNFFRRPYSQKVAETKVLEREERVISLNDYAADQHLYKDILKAYPAPRNRLSNFYDVLEQTLGKENLKTTSSKLNGTKWEYKYKLNWPEKVEFVGVSSSKKEAAKIAAVQALKWLKDLGKIDLRGNLFTINKKEFVKQETQKPVARIKLEQDYVDETEYLVEEFDQKFSNQLHEACSQWSDMNKPSYFDTGVSKFDKFDASESALERRNNDLLAALNKRRKLPPRNLSLPITEYGTSIIELVRDNPVVVIKGEPGCGKSTQVPQMIFDDYTERLEGTKCNIVVTQPRKISATSIAERIADERYEAVGDVIGYQVRFASKLPKFRDGNILFCTLGIMLRKLLSPDGLRGITHLIIDEAHERDLNTDILLLLSKRAVENNPNFRIIIMSATINPELFQNYFNNAPSLLIPGFTQLVTSRFLDDNMKKDLRLMAAETKKEVGDSPSVDPLLITKMVNWVNTNRPPGAILVFLPGWGTIRKVRDELEGSHNLFVVPVHSRLSHDDQRKIFMQPPRGMRKVVLATNIAETSITINDVIYVIDSGLLKENRLSSKESLSCLDNHWTSKASVIQRKGRAGRVQPGECFHLYTKEKFESMDDFPMPEVHRIRLEMVVLQSKTYSGHEKAVEFLSQLPEPPSLMVIKEAVKTLRFIGALDEDENLTPLGHRISIFTTDPLISKALVHAFFFKCVNPLVTIGTILSSDIELFPGMAFDKSPIREGKSRFSPTSDHIAMVWLFQQWTEYLANNESRARQLMEEMLGSHQGFLFVKRLQELVADHLRQCQLSPTTSSLFSKRSDCNTHAVNDELIKGVFLSGVGNLLISRNYQIKKGVLKKTSSLVTLGGHKSIIAAESVNHKRTDFPSPLITYFGEAHSAQNKIAMIRETSIVSPLTVALFQPGTLTTIKPIGQDMEASNDVTLQLKSKNLINFGCDERTANALVKLRETLWTVIDYFVLECGNPQNAQLYNDVSDFHDKVLNLLNKMLLEAGTFIDYDEHGNIRSVVGKKSR